MPFGVQSEADSFGGFREIKKGVVLSPRLIIISVMIVSMLASQIVNDEHTDKIPERLEGVRRFSFSGVRG
jgi:hypothetical protein